jgi:hypothetical protein
MSNPPKIEELEALRGKKRKATEVKEEAKKALDELDLEERMLIVKTFAAKAQEIKTFRVWKVADEKGSYHVFATRQSAVEFKPIDGNVFQQEMSEETLLDFAKSNLLHFY